MAKVGPCSLNDPNSFSNPEDIRVDHHDIHWTVDFDRKIIFGWARYRLKWIKPGANLLKFDTRDLEIKCVKNGKCQQLKYSIGDSVLSFGKPLTIELLKDDGGAGSLDIQVEYETKPSCSALQWLAKEQTSGKEFPYMFSQCQANHARSFLPCQDTPFVKSTYTAEVFAPSALTVLMSAIRNGEPVFSSTNKNLRLHKFIQKVPIPSYLFAIVTGKLSSKKIGPRTTIWAEEAFVEPAAIDFADTEEFITIAEDLVGEYVWGVYDLLVLPPSFPFGGMENPCLTFVTPTLLAGDKSLANVVAHEIAHSWTGNLVTNKNWEHFWLNEGFTVFLERKIFGRMYGEAFRQFKSIGGIHSLNETIMDTFGPTHPFTSLVLDLKGVDPDDAYSTVPYEKGYIFLYYLEQLVGGPTSFEPFFKDYIQSHRYQSIDTDEFKTFFVGYFTKQGKGSEIGDIDWNKWLLNPGMPDFDPKYDTSLSDACTALVKRWFDWNPSENASPFKGSDLDAFTLKSHQEQQFLQQVLAEADPLPLEKVKAMQEAYNFSVSKNCEILFSWIRICIRAKWTEQIPLALKFITDQNRMKYIRPIYRDLNAVEEYRTEAVATFEKNRGNMMHTSAYTVAKDLGL